jgi:hypothetical protein
MCSEGCIHAGANCDGTNLFVHNKAGWLLFFNLNDPQLQLLLCWKYVERANDRTDLSVKETGIGRKLTDSGQLRSPPVRFTIIEFEQHAEVASKYLTDVAGITVLAVKYREC